MATRLYSNDAVSLHFVYCRRQIVDGFHFINFYMIVGIGRLRFEETKQLTYLNQFSLQKASK